MMLTTFNPAQSIKKKAITYRNNKTLISSDSLVS